jgi:hypothetical protein
MEPTAGEMDQVTAVLVVPVTESVNCSVPEAERVTVAGDTETATVLGEAAIEDVRFTEYAVAET